jgi:inner membrane protein
MGFLRSELLKKGMSLALVLLMLMIGLSMISGVSRDRSAQRYYAVQSIQQSAAGPQSLAGPVISRTCVEESQLSKVVDGKTVTETKRESRVLRAFPASLDWKGDITVEPRRRSLYTVNTYRTSLTGSAKFANAQNLAVPLVDASTKISCGPQRLDVLLTHQNGIQSAEIKIDGSAATLLSGVSVEGAAGFSVSLPALADEAALAKPMAVDLKIDLLGMESFSMLPVGNDNQMKLTSAWPHPSFAGSFLPREKTITAAGFDASWRVSSLATDAQSSFPCGLTSNGVNAGHKTSATGCAGGMAVNLVDPVNASALSERAVKYGELFISLTFIGLGLFELLRRVKVHPIQYLLIGAALAVFFLLLLSVSEHVPFAVAYLLAALGCSALIAVYAKSVLGGWRAALPLTLGCATLYGVLYLVLQSEQHALLAGSLLIFAVLAAVMISTRNIRWGSLNGVTASAVPSTPGDRNA